MSALSGPTRAGGFASLLGRLSSLARELVFAAVFGASSASDLWLAAARVPNLFRDVLAEGAMAAALVPALARRQQEAGPIGAFSLLNALLGVLLGVLGLLTGAMMWFAEPAARLVAAGFEQTPGKLELTSSLVVWAAPGLAAASLSSAVGALLQVQGRFFIPALTPVVVNLAVIGACVLGEGDAEQRVWRLAVASTLGGALGVVVQLGAAWRSGYRLSPHVRGHPALRPLLVTLGPAMIGVLAGQASGLIDTRFASAAGDGALSAVTYAYRLAQLPRSLAAVPIATAGLAVIAAALSRQEPATARKHARDVLASSVWVGLPAMLLIGFWSEPLVRAVYQRGAFVEADVRATAAVLQAYSPTALAFVLHSAVVAVLAAWGDTRWPMWVALFAVGLKVPLAAWWVSRSGVEGIAWAHSAIILGETLFLLLVLQHTVRVGWPRLGRTFVGFAVMALTLRVGAELPSAWTPGAAVMDLLLPLLSIGVYVLAAGLPAGLRRDK